MCYFPHIVEGPFDRYKELSSQFSIEHHFDYEKFQSAALLIIWGLFKKMVVADAIGEMVVAIFGAAEEYSGTGILIGTILYTFQLYADFSGCIEIVSGVSRLFGITLAENFKQPFFAKSIDEFWRRWHISLGAWLREYVFYPVCLSGQYKKLDAFLKKHFKQNRMRDFFPVAYSLFFVWFCNGLWHGASGKYIIYGMYYYVLMMIGQFFEPEFEKAANLVKIDRKGKAFAFFRMARTFLIVNVGMLLFRSASIGEFAQKLGKIVTSVSVADIMKIVLFARTKGLIVAVGMLAIFVVDYLKENDVNIPAWMMRKPYLVKCAIYSVLIFVIICFATVNYSGAEVYLYADF